MAEIVTMPKWGLTMEEGKILEWMLEEDEPVKAGDVLCMVETEKINVELPSPYAGVVACALVEDGQVVKVGDPIMIIAATLDEARAVRHARSP